MEDLRYGDMMSMTATFKGCKIYASLSDNIWPKEKTERKTTTTWERSNHAFTDLKKEANISLKDQRV